MSVIDSGADLAHPDLAYNIWINQGEIPPTLAPHLVDSDQDGRISFVDLNASENESWVTDANQNGIIDAIDLSMSSQWFDGVDNDANGFRDDMFGWNFEDNVANRLPVDDNGHGTHVTGILAAVGNNGIGISGATQQASVMTLRFLDENNAGLVSNAIRAINYATMMRRDHDVNVRIVNNSWISQEGFNQALADAVQAGAAEDILYVSGAGNGNVLRRPNDNDFVPVYPASLDSDHVISVTATDEQDRLVPFYNFGAQSVDLAGPGLGIYSTALGGGYEHRSGTSMATSLVSGTAALLMSSQAGLTALEVRRAILDSVDPLADVDRPLVATGGRLNAHAALSVDRFYPRASLSTGDTTIDVATNLPHVVQVQYRDVAPINQTNTVARESIDANDLLVRRVDGAEVDLAIHLAQVDSPADAPTLTATYEIASTEGWSETDNGVYEILLADNEIRDASPNGNLAPETRLGRFVVDILPDGTFRVNTLEDTIDVDISDGRSLDENGKSSLRSAIQQANANVDANTIIVPAGVYDISRAGLNEDNAALGDLDIRHTLTIRGAGSGIDLAAQRLQRSQILVSETSVLSFDVEDSPITLSTEQRLNEGTGRIESFTTLQIPRVALHGVSGALISDGETIVLAGPGDQTRTLEFDRNGSVGVGNIPVPVFRDDTPTVVATRVTEAINANIPEIQAFADDDVVDLGWDVVVLESGSWITSGSATTRIVDGQTIVVTNENERVTLEFDSNGVVAPGHLPINIDDSMGQEEINAAIVEALNLNATVLSGNTIVDANQLDRVFHVHPNANVVFENVIVRGGFVEANELTGFGGGILQEITSEVVVRESRLAGNDAELGGGYASLLPPDGLAERATTIFEHVVLENNHAVSQGGAVFNGGQFRIVNSTIQDNDAGRRGWSRQLLRHDYRVHVNTTQSGRPMREGFGWQETGRSSSACLL